MSVYLRTNPEIVYDRMKKRGRLEENTVSYDYIKSLHESHEKWLLSNNNNIKQQKIIVIDANKSLEMVLQQCDEYMDKVVSKSRIRPTRSSTIQLIN